MINIQSIHFKYRYFRPLASTFNLNNLNFNLKNYAQRWFSSSRGGAGSTIDFDPSINYYKVLGLQDSATEIDIKKAFYDLAKKFHPDAINKDLNTKQKEDKFKEVSNAYDVLSDQTKRSLYDDLRNQSQKQRTTQNQSSYYQTGQEWTYNYDSNGNKRTTYSDNRQQSHYYYDQRDDFYNRSWKHATYEEARRQYQRSYKAAQEDREKHSSQSYRDRYNEYEREQFEKFKEMLKGRKRKQQYNGPEEAPSQDEMLRSLLLSLLGFCAITYILFGMHTSSKINEPPITYTQPSSGLNGYMQNKSNQYYTNTPSTFHGKVLKQNNELPSDIGAAYNYYNSFAGVVPIPKMEIRNSSTRISTAEANQIIESNSQKQKKP